MRILIVDEDPVLVEKLPPLLRQEGHQVYLHPEFGGLFDFVADEGINLLVCDPSRVPFNLALEVCHAVRQESSAMILLVSGSTNAAERARALDAGADDYVSKPFDTEELLARVRALLRRHPLSLFGQGGQVVRLTEELWLDLAGQRLVARRREVLLSALEFQLLVYMVRREGAVLSRDALVAAVWGTGYEGSTREVDVYISYLRRKLEPDPSQPRYILSSWGRGYQYRRPRVESKETEGNLRQFPRRRDSGIARSL
ncbi:MAG: response regulator transcription factor [Chloroflexi bacterium]|nr:response regulator transcription factor [Chloroflexota bacterium]